MKCILTLFIILVTKVVFAQPVLPTFLQGTWKMENSNNYEHWDMLNENMMKGFSYKLKDGKMIVSEYLKIVRIDGDVVYTATVLNQNMGNSIDFKLTLSDSNYIFQNPHHDFPKRIAYQKVSGTEVFVQVSDGKQKIFSYSILKQHVPSEASDSSVKNPNFDSALAQKLGADNYGMKRYILVILKTGSNQSNDKSFVSSMFKGHLENINTLVEQNLLVVAGPISKNENNYRGIFILNVTSFEEAEKLLQTDPAIESGLLAFELYTWYGSAALPEYLEYSDKIWKEKP